MRVSQCEFESNQASLAGGGIYVMNTAIFTADNSSFVGNRAGQGGAINIEVCLLCNFIPVTSCLLQNQAILRGQTTTVQLTDITFKSNSAVTTMNETGEAFGGAVRIVGIGVDSEIYGCKFQNNRGSLGGGLSLLEAFSTQIEDSR